MKRLISIFALLLSACAAFAVESGDDVMRLTPIGYRLGEAGGVTAYDQSVVTVTPVDTRIVYSNKAVTLTAALNRDYKVVCWQKFDVDPTIRTDADPIGKFGEKSETVSVDFNPNVVWMYVTVVVEYDPVRTVKASVSSFAKDRGTVSVSPEKASYLKGDVVTLTAEPAEGYSFVRWSDGNADHERTLTVDDDVDLKAYIEPISSKVTFSSGVGAVLDVTSKRVSYDSAYGELPVPTRTGAQFSGWADDEKRTVTEKTTVNRIADHTLYASWSDLLYKIDWDFTGRGNGKVEGTGTYAYGSQPTLKAVPYEGSTFTGWTDGELLNPRRITVTSNAMYVAAFDVATYDVTFTYRDKDGNPVTIGPTTVEHGGKIDPPSQDVVDSWTDHTFKTWSTEEYKKVTRDLAVEAIYDMETYKVMFAYCDRLGHSVTTMPQHVVSGGKANPPSKDVVDNREGYTFKGWDPDYNVIRGDTLCEAIYDDVRCTVKFSYRDKDGNLVVEDVTVKYGKAVLETSVPPKSKVDQWPDHEFLGWDERYVEATNCVTDDLTVNARYKDVIAVIYSPGEGQGDRQKFDLEEEGSYVILNPTNDLNYSRIGYTFDYWQSDDEKNYQPGDKVKLKAGDTLALTAIWANNKYTIAFNGNGGECKLKPPVTATYDKETVIKYNKLNESQDVERANYRFLFWSRDPVETNEIYKTESKYPYNDVLTVSNLTATAGDVVTLYAIWKGEPQEVFINGKPVKLEYGSQLMKSMVPDPEPEVGHTFTGSWKTNNDVIVEFPIVVTGSFNLDPVIVPNSYKVAFHGTDADGGMMDPQPFTYDVEQALTSNAFTRTGYTFANWTNEVGKAFADGAQVKNLATNDGAVVDLYATWTMNPRYYAVRFNPNGGADESYVQTIECGVETALTPNRFARTGYGFANWTDAMGTVYTDGAKVTDLAAEGETNDLYAVWTPNRYWVKFDGNTADDGEMDNQPFTYDVAQALSPNGFTKTGHTFAGWATNATGAAVFADKATVSNLTAEANATNTLFAAWTVNKYTVVIDGVPTEMDYGSDIEEPVDPVARKGYTFTGWTTNKVPVAAWPLKVPLGGLEICSAWAANKYTVEFCGTDGTYETSGTMAPQEFDYDVAQQLKANEFTRDWHVFAGWTNGAGRAFANQEAVSNLTATAGGVVTLWATWTDAPSYTVRFNPNGGVGESYVQAIECGVETALTPNRFARTGYGFANWTNSTGTVYTDGAKVTDLAAEGETNDLYAAWTPNRYWVKFDGNTADDGEMDNQPFTYDAAQALSPNGFTRTGYGFTGWVTNLTGSAVFEDKATVSNLTAEANATNTLWATWRANKYKVRYNPNGGKGELYTQDFTYDQTQALKGNDFTPPETWMAFVGWSNTTDSVVYKPDTFVSNLTAVADEIVDLYAVWADDSYTVTFDGNRATDGDMESQVFKHGELGTLTPNAYVRTGFGFKNWTNDVGDAYSDGVDFTAPSTGTGETLYAVWTNCEYYCRFDGEKDGPYHYGDKIERSDPTKLGYVFLGWTNETGIVDLKMFTMPDHDVAFGSKWSPIKYTVEFHGTDGTYATQGAMEPQEFTYDVEQALSPNKFTRAGYEFTQWTNKVGDVFTDGKRVKNLATTDGAKVILYAAWQETGNPLSIALGLDANFDVSVNDEGAWTVIGEPKEKNGLQRTSASVGGTLRVTVPSAGTLVIGFDAGGSVISGLTYSDGSHSVTKKSNGNYSIGVESACTVTFSGTPDSGCTWTLKNFKWTAK